ncbi:MAG: CDP-alcohol phosphatidyltransferase family protein, partial [Oscillospiraceae bacterium]
MNLPNWLSVFRLFLVPVFVLAFFFGGEYHYILATAVYVAAEITDCLDGYIARKYSLITRLGRVLDPLADKLLAFTVLVCIVIASRVPIWAAVLFFIKEALMGIGAFLMYKKIDDIMPSNILGKVANVVFFANCIILMFDP